MPTLTREFIVGDIYHLFNRGVEKRQIFMDESDRFRFVFSLYECNDANFVIMRNRINDRLFRKNYISKNHIGDTYANLPAFQTKREMLVEIIAFVLMPNHYHLIVRPLVEGGVSLFMKKLSNSYTGYFNDKYERKGMGALFQSAFKAVRVEGDGQFLHLAEYLFANPVEIIDPGWKDRGAQDIKKAIEFVNNYKWSSYSDSIGIDNFPSVTARDFLWQVFGGKDGISAGHQNVKQYVEEWIKNKQFLFSELTME